ncbi:MAG: amidohydrolase family protein [Nitrospiraceae bacterium]|nr:amidohydrolase family protein [Nitrospiraceae bacterium]
MIPSGYIDLHTHGGGRYDTRTDDASSILKMAEYHGAAGTAAILPTIYPGPVDEMRRNMAAVREAIGIQENHGMQGRHTSARILGAHLEGPFLNPGRRGALDAGSLVKPSVRVLKSLITGYEDVIKIITVAPELPGALRVIRSCSDAGIRVNMGHSDATYEQALRGKAAGAGGITHIFNGMRPFHHREPGLAGLGLLDEELYIEVIADGVHLHPQALALIFGSKRLDRIILVSDSVKGGRKGRPVFNDRAILAGSGITLSDSRAVLRGIGVPEAEIAEAASDNPARYLGLKPA